MIHLHINFNDMSICLGNHVHSTFIFTLLCSHFLRVCFVGVHPVLSNILFKQIYLTHRWGTKTFTSPGQNGLGNKGVMAINTPHFPDLQDWNVTIRCSLVLYPGHTIFCGEVNSRQGIHSAYSHPTVKTIYIYFFGLSTTLITGYV